jgi:manganese transport protein
LILQSTGESQRSLEDIHSTVPIPRSGWRRFLAFSGPALLVSVGYMDPGNWATDIEAGSKYGYTLLWILLLSNLMAILLQTLSARLGIVAGRDLAQACRESYPRWTGASLWVLSEIAIAACDLAEVIGTVIALNLLFKLPYLWGLVIAAGDTFLLLALQRRGVRLLELVTLGLIAVIAGSFVFEIVLAKPDWAAVLRGFVPGLATENAEAFKDSLYVAIGMLGATVMPHNLYLHSALVQTRSFPQTGDGKRLACKYNLIDSCLALNSAFFVNAAILILSVSTFFMHNRIVETLGEAHKLLESIWQTTLASGLFAVALLASGQSSTLTGTLAGQVVMEGFLRLRLRPWVRRLLTRSVAIVPALVVIAFAGAGTDSKKVDRDLVDLILLSQVILSFQLPFAIVPLVHFTSERRRMGSFTNPIWLKVVAWACAIIVVGLNAIFLSVQIAKWADGVTEGEGSVWWVYTIGMIVLGLVAFLGWVTFYPWLRRRVERPKPASTPEIPRIRYQRIGAGVELEGTDDAVLAQAGALARAHRAKLFAIHVVEGFGAAFHGSATDDQESRSDRQRMAGLTEHLKRDGLDAQGVLGYGNPADELVRIAQEHKLDLLVLGSHGHRFLADLALGQTVSPVLHRLTIPVLVVPNRPTAPAATTRSRSETDKRLAEP